MVERRDGVVEGARGVIDADRLRGDRHVVGHALGITSEGDSGAEDARWRLLVAFPFANP